MANVFSLLNLPTLGRYLTTSAYNESPSMIYSSKIFLTDPQNKPFDPKRKQKRVSNKAAVGVIIEPKCTNRPWTWRHPLL